MKGRLFLIVSLIFILTGCATGRRLQVLETKTEVLDSKVGSLEQRQNTMEAQTGESRESVGYLKGKVEEMPKALQGETVMGQRLNRGYLYNSHKRTLSKKEIQIALKNAGFYHGKIDGKIGKNTKIAIKEFQKTNGLKPDGKIGGMTRALLSQYLK